MTVLSTSSSLQQYLNKVKQANQGEQAKGVKKKHDSKAKSRAKPTYIKLNRELLHFITQTSGKIKKDIQTLTQEERDIALMLLQLTSGRTMAYTDIVNKLATSHAISKLKLKALLASLLEKQVVIVEDHEWQEQQLKVASLWIEPLLAVEDAKEISPRLSQSMLAISGSFHPFSKQLIFLMYQLKYSLLHITQFNKLSRQQLYELRAKALEYNPMLSLLDDPLVAKELTIDDGYTSFACEDSIVCFIIELALSLQFIQIRNKQLVWLEQNWIAWLEGDEEAKSYSLRLLIAELLLSQDNRELRYWFLKLLITPSYWIKLNKEAAAPRHVVYAVKLASSLGWIEAVYDVDGCYYVRRKRDNPVKSGEPVAFNQLQVYCFEDCSPVALWHMLHIGQLLQRLEIIKFQLDTVSLLHAFNAGYTEQQIKKLLKINEESQMAKSWDRLVSLSSSTDKPILAAMNKRIKAHIKEDNSVEVTKLNEEQEALNAYSSRFEASLKVKAVSYVNLIATDIDESKLKLAQLPQIWFSALRSYNTVTLKKMLIAALNIGLEVEVVAEDKCLLLIPISVPEDAKGEKDIVIKFFASNPNLRCNVKKVEIDLANIAKIRLIREY